jgi:disulfide bond formation protein DsbB
MIRLPSRAWLLVGMAAAAIGAVAVAVTMQHVFDYQPCPWCILQRMIYVVIALVALSGAAASGAWGRAGSPVVIVLLTVGGVATALWQHFVAAASSSCALTFADRVVTASHLDLLMPEVFQPRASCADAAVDMLGIPFEFWSLWMFVLLAAAALLLLRRERAAPALSAVPR